MNPSRRSECSEDEVVLRLLRTASDGQAVPAEGHFIDDEETLACWEAGLLTTPQRAQIVAHLADCPRCRRELAGMIRRGEMHWAPTEPAVTPAPQAERHRSIRVWLSLAVAASLLLAVGLLGGRWWRPDGVGGIASGSALAMRGKITDYGYLLDSQSVAKGFAPLDAALERHRKELLATIQAQPAARTSQLAYGELLLRLDEPAEAARVFEQLVQTDQQDLAGRLGLGLAWFLKGQTGEVLVEFQVVL